MEIQSNNQTQGGSWLSPSPGLHINETTPHCSQLQPLPDRCLWSKTTSHSRLNPHLLTVTTALHEDTYIISLWQKSIWDINYACSTTDCKGMHPCSPMLNPCTVWLTCQLNMYLLSEWLLFRVTRAKAQCSAQGCARHPSVRGANLQYAERFTTASSYDPCRPPCALGHWTTT